MNNFEIIKKVAVILTILGMLGYTIFYYKNKKKEEEFYEEYINNSFETNEVKINEERHEKIKVYITGEIKQPGVKELEEGDRIEDLINIAGGLTTNADISGVNLAYYVQDGMKVCIPNVNEKNQNEIISMENEDGIIKNMENKSQGKINLNTASLTELCALPGVGESLAQRIIDYREENGKFEKKEDLKNVSGFGEKKYENLKDYIVVK